MRSTDHTPMHQTSRTDPSQSRTNRIRSSPAHQPASSLHALPPMDPREPVSKLRVRLHGNPPHTKRLTCSNNRASTADNPPTTLAATNTRQQKESGQPPCKHTSENSGVVVHNTGVAGDRSHEQYEQTQPPAGSVANQKRKTTRSKLTTSCQHSFIWGQALSQQHTDHATSREATAHGTNTKHEATRSANPANARTRTQTTTNKQTPA